MCEMTAQPMTDAEPALYRAQRALALWQSAREVAMGNLRLDGQILSHLSKAMIAAERAVRRSVRHSA